MVGYYGAQATGAATPQGVPSQGQYGFPAGYGYPSAPSGGQEN